MHIQSPGQEDPLEEGMETPSIFLPGESHGQRSLMGYHPWGCKGFRHDLVTKQQQQIERRLMSTGTQKNVMD